MLGFSRLVDAGATLCELGMPECVALSGTLFVAENTLFDAPEGAPHRLAFYLEAPEPQLRAAVRASLEP